MDEEYDCIVLGTGLKVCSIFHPYLYNPSHSTHLVIAFTGHLLKRTSIKYISTFLVYVINVFSYSYLSNNRKIFVKV